MRFFAVFLQGSARSSKIAKGVPKNKVLKLHAVKPKAGKLIRHCYWFSHFYPSLSKDVNTNCDNHHILAEISYSNGLPLNQR